MKVENDLMQRTLACHGADRMDFVSFDITEAVMYNVDLHFGTKASTSIDLDAKNSNVELGG